MSNIRQRRVHNLNEYVIVYVIVGSKKIPPHKDFRIIQPNRRADDNGEGTGKEVHGSRQSPESDGAACCWLQSLEAPTLPPGGVAPPRDPVLMETNRPEITHENRLSATMN